MVMMGWLGVLGETGHDVASDRVTSLQGPPGEAGYDGVDGEQVSCAAGHGTNQPVHHPSIPAQPGTGTVMGTASFLLPRAKRGPPAPPERRGPGGGRCGIARPSLGEALPPSPAALSLNPFLLPSPRGKKAPGVPGGRRDPQALAERW